MFFALSGKPKEKLKKSDNAHVSIVLSFVLLILAK